jgi:flagellar basal-body rod modification protein FlgD
MAERVCKGERMTTVAPSSSLAASSGSSVTTDAFSSLSSGDFVKIMLSELSRQDPTKPNDSSELIQQLNGIRSIQSNLDLQTKLSDLIGQNSQTTAAGLIGKGVSGLSETGERVEGIVMSVSRTSDGSVLTLDDGSRVNFKNVDTTLNRELGQNDLAFAASLIGKRVAGTDSANAEFAGSVKSVTQTASGPVLTITASGAADRQVSLYSVRTIDETPAF